VAKGSVAGDETVIVKPQTYMNRSGTALGPLLDRSDFDPTTDLLVVVDDIAIPMGSFRIRSKGSDGGHNGLKSIAGRLASDEYARLRIGVGPRPVGENQADFLLSPFEEDELDTLRELVPTLIEAVECWTRDGIELAMNRYNRRGTQSD
jgi:PTH1 family peptidyl-tRNA hydrolase